MAVQQGSLLIGRDPTCQLDLQDDDQVSHQHAVLEQRADGIWIKDMGALNRTQVNGQPVEEVRLQPGDHVEIGRTQFEFQIIESAPAGSHRRVSQVQVLTFVAIGLVFAVQGLFMFIQFARGPVRPTVTPSPAGLSTNNLEPDLQRALALRSATSQVPSAATGDTTSVEAEVAELRAAVAGLREQLGDIAVPTDAVPAQVQSVAAAPTEAVVAVATNPAVPPVSTETSTVQVAERDEFPVREEPPPLIDVPQAAQERPPMEDPIMARAKQLMELAQQDIARSNLTGADQLLERIQVMAPDFLPAYIERAKLYEKRAMLNKAGEQWALIMDRSKGTPLYATAVAVRQRLAQAEVAVSTTRKNLDERPLAARLPRRIRIVSVDRERFPGSKEFDEMRLVRVNLKSRSSDDDVDTEELEVRTYFFDRVIGTGEVKPTGGTVPGEPLRVDGAWPAGESRALTATYILRKGFRQDEEQKTGEKRIYEGYRVQVYYRGELQDEDAQPRTLLKVDLPEPTVVQAPIPAVVPKPEPESETKPEPVLENEADLPVPLR